MNNEITAEEVAHQFAKSIQLFLEWMEPVSYTHLTLPTTPYV